LTFQLATLLNGLSTLVGIVAQNQVSISDFAQRPVNF